MNPSERRGDPAEPGSQLLLATGYLSIFLMPALLALGIWSEHPYLAFGTAMLVFPLARGVFGPYPEHAPIIWNERIATLLDRLPMVYCIVLLMLVLLVLALINAGAAETPAKALGIGLSLWMTMLFATCPAHELIHRRDPREARAGRLLAGLAGYPVLAMEHLIHHTRFGDTERAEWPRVNESVWQFAGRRLYRLADKLLLRRHGSHLSNSQVRDSAVVTLAMLAAFTFAGGWAGFLIYLGVIVGVTFGVQVMTYLQHWGLGDDSLAEASSRQYGWEDDCLFQAWVTLHISFHQAHHEFSRLPYYRVTVTPDSPRQPAGYVILMLVCLFPRLWRRLMQPALDHWKRQPLQPRSSGRRLTCFALYGGETTSKVNRFP